jgi:hypothetical protein
VQGQPGRPGAAREPPAGSSAGKGPLAPARLGAGPDQTGFMAVLAPGVHSLAPTSRQMRSLAAAVYSFQFSVPTTGWYMEWHVAPSPCAACTAAPCIPPEVFAWVLPALGASPLPRSELAVYFSRVPGITSPASAKEPCATEPGNFGVGCIGPPTGDGP